MRADLQLGSGRILFVLRPELEKAKGITEMDNLLANEGPFKIVYEMVYKRRNVAAPKPTTAKKFNDAVKSAQRDCPDGGVADIYNKDKERVARFDCR